MRRRALGEAELNNARLLPRARPSALHIEFCISPVGAVLVCRSLFAEKWIQRIRRVPISANVRGGWRKKPNQNKLRLTGGPDGP